MLEINSANNTVGLVWAGNLEIYFYKDLEMITMTKEIWDTLI